MENLKYKIDIVKPVNIELYTTEIYLFQLWEPIILCLYCGGPFSCDLFNPFLTNVPLLYPMKTLENRRFSDVFRGYRSGTFVENGLIFNVESSWGCSFTYQLSLLLFCHYIQSIFVFSNRYFYIYNSKFISLFSLQFNYK